MDAIEVQLPADLIARVEEGVSIDTEEGSRTVSLDVQVVESAQSVAVAGTGASAATITEPVVVPVDEVFTERHIEIIDPSSGGRVVTAIEVLSPSDKIPHDGREKYIQKQREYLAGGVNLIEVDLIRNGIHTIAVPLGNIPPHSRGGYYVCVRRASRPNEAFVSMNPFLEQDDAWHDFHEQFCMECRALPRIPIPLRAPDPDSELDLQQALHRAYDAGGYRSYIYAGEPLPPLSNEDAAWADELLRSAGTQQ